MRDLVTAVPTSANVKYYAQIVKDNSMRRKLIKLNEEIENECYVGKESVETVMDITEKKVFDLLSTRGGGGDYVPIRQVVMNALEKIENAAKTSGTVTGIPTGFIDLDYRTAGLQPSDLILIAARPSMGKTAFVLNIAQYVAFQRKYVYRHLFARDVQGAACQPSVLSGVQSGCSRRSVLVISRMQTGRS